MKAMKQILVAASLVVISATAPVSWKRSSTAQHIRRICHRIHQRLGQQFHKSHCLVRGVFISRYAARIRATRHFLSQFTPARRC